jgi:anti-sigma factor RsiW
VSDAGSDAVNDCEWAEPRLGAWLDGELEPEEARRVMAHVERCAACERRRRLVIETSSLLRGLGDQMLEAARPAARVEGVELVARARAPRGWMWIAAAAALIAFVVGFTWASRTRAAPPLAEECAHCGPEPFPVPSATSSVAKRP